MADAKTEFQATVRADTSQAVQEFKRAGGEIDKAMDRASRSTEKLDNAMVKLARGAVGGVAFREIAQFSMSLVKSTAQLEDTIAAASVTFGEYSDQIEDFATSAAKNFGISKMAAIDAANTFAALGKSAGLTGTQLTGFSTEMVALAGDLASFRGTSVEDAISAIGSGLRGEAEPLRRFGVLLDDATLKARAMAMGIDDGIGPLTAQQKVLAAQAEILAQTTDAQGDFARTSDSTANSMKTLRAEFENAKAVAGEALAPALTALSQSLIPVLEGFSAMPEQLQIITVNSTLAVGAFNSASQALQGLGIAAKTANIAAGGVIGVLTLATTAYSLYQMEKAEAVQRTEDLTSALKLEGDAQKKALAQMALADMNVEGFIKGMTSLGLTTDEVSQYMNTGTGVVADLNDEFIAATSTVNGLYPEYAAIGNELLNMNVEGEDLNRVYQNMTDEQQTAAANAKLFFEMLVLLREQMLLSQDAALLVSIATGDVGTSAEGATDSVDELENTLRGAGNEFKLLGVNIGGVNDEIAFLLDLLSEEQTILDIEVGLRELTETADAYYTAVAEGSDEAIALGQEMQGEAIKYKELLLNAIGEIDNVPTAVVTRIRALLDQGSFDVAAAEIEGLLSGEVRFGYTGRIIDVGIDGERAMGGPVSAGGAYLVGERGPEVFLPGSSGMIIPNGGLGGGNVTVVINNPVSSGEQIANELAAYVRRNGTRFLTGVS